MAAATMMETPSALIWALVQFEVLRWRPLRQDVCRVLKADRRTREAALLRRPLHSGRVAHQVRRAESDSFVTARKERNRWQKSGFV